MGVDLCGIEDQLATISFTSATRESRQPVDLSKRAAFVAGSSTQGDASSPYANQAAQLALEHWYQNNMQSRRDFGGAPTFTATSPVGTVATNANPFKVTTVNSFSTQPVSGQVSEVSFQASNGADSVDITSTVSYAADGTAISGGAAGSTAGGGGGGGLSAGAIAGIVVGSTVGGLLALGVVTAVIAAVVVGTVILVKNRGSSPAPEPVQEGEPAPKKRGMTWFNKRTQGGQFQSITGRSPPVKLKTAA